MRTSPHRHARMVAAIRATVERDASPDDADYLTIEITV
jgi:hypothetical protein